MNTNMTGFRILFQKSLVPSALDKVSLSIGSAKYIKVLGCKLNVLIFPVFQLFALQEFCGRTKDYCPPGEQGPPGVPGKYHFLP